MALPKQVLVTLESIIDDASGETVAYAMERLEKEGALNVHALQGLSKKNRPAVVVRVICAKKDADRLGLVLLRETGSIGYREYACNLRFLPRTKRSVQTPYGPVTVKISHSRLEGIRVVKPEFNDCKKLAETHHVPLSVVRAAALKAAGSE